MTRKTRSGEIPGARWPAPERAGEPSSQIVEPASARPLASCQCPRWPTSGSCARQATQEDLLCDPCRRGCASVGFGSAGTPAEQIPMASGHWGMPVVTRGDAS